MCFALSVFHAIWSDSVNARSDSVRFGQFRSDSVNCRTQTYQDFMFDYTAKIAGIGDRSELTVEIDLS